MRSCPRSWRQRIDGLSTGDKLGKAQGHAQSQCDEHWGVCSTRVVFSCCAGRQIK